MSAAPPLRIVVLGLSLSSSWGNGHATTYRALLRAFAARGHEVLFLERDTPWYARHRDLEAPGFCTLAFYDDLMGLQVWGGAIADADAVILGSYVPDGVAVGDLVLKMARGVTAFYDIDTPVTLSGLERGEVAYIAARQIPGYDLYLSFTGGPTLDLLERRYHARAARQLYCSADAEAYRPIERAPRWDLSYLGTYSPDRQPALERLLLEPARRAPDLRFVVAGPQYPGEIRWPANVQRIDHLPPAEHAVFYTRSRFTLNVTRAAMVQHGYSPSVRLFEAGACGTAIISDIWDGVDTILTPGSEILLAQNPDDVLDILRQLPEARRRAIGQAARAHVLRDHTAARRAAELESHLRQAIAGRAGAFAGAPRDAGQTLSMQVPT
ncbi:glycosyltransferase [Roseomonas hellenica]|uniref:Glycosyltransferase n=1 Tax=Plastoroseomonas hellenica TaxID=2687306 RepID=A0ABS5F005_9PROT|nr:glycosyltransferase [Plastoroseomonas hellenica]MBR0665520.1 glycosyltransferase [Plastoroseomonas hellenica]